MEYDVIHSETIEDLIARTNAATNDGWKPQGGIAVFTPYLGNPDYYQAMIRLATQE